MSGEKKRDYGFGVPNWSPHWVPDARTYARRASRRAAAAADGQAASQGDAHFTPARTNATSPAR